MTEQKSHKKETQVLRLEDFNVNQLPELQGKKEEIKAIIDANPIVKIVDTKTYDEAKKSRTAVRSLRTSLESEKKDVLNRIKEKIVNTVSTAYDAEISDVKIEEELRQYEVTEWEDAKKKEAEEKRLAEEKRVKDIKESIAKVSSLWKERFEKLSFDNIDFVQKDFKEVIGQTNRNAFAEFALLFDKEVSLLTEILNAKVNSLTEAENNRLERERLAQAALETERINKVRSMIADWYSTWLSKIHHLTFEDIQKVSETFENEKALECSEFQEDYGNRRAELQAMLSDKVKSLKEAEEQRIERENFQKEKAEFAAKQLKARTESRIKQLTDLGISEEVIENGMGENSRWATLKGSAETEEDAIWEETLLWVETTIAMRNKAKAEPSPEMIKGIEVEEEAIDLINTYVTNETPGIPFYDSGKDIEERFDKMVSEKTSDIVKPHLEDSEIEGPTFYADPKRNEIKADGFSTSEETGDVTMEVDFEETFESIFETFRNETFNDEYHSTYAFVEWLSENYEVPKRKKE